MILFCCYLDMLDKVFKSKPQLAATKEHTTKVAVETLKLGGIQFLVLQAEIVQATYHHEAWTGGGEVSKPQLEKAFDSNEGFAIQFRETDIWLPFTWK